MSASPYDWATFFTGAYAVKVNDVFSHDAALMFTERPNAAYEIFSVCLTATLKPSGVPGNAAGHFHLKTLTCDYPGSYQKPGTALDGSVMECTYTGAHGDSGFFRVGFWERDPDFTTGISVPVLGEWRGTIFVNWPDNTVKQKLIMTAKERKKRPDINYPWNI